LWQKKQEAVPSWNGLYRLILFDLHF